MGIALTGGGGIDNTGVIAGGAGGAGNYSTRNALVGGNGGAGVLLTSGGTVLNAGTIQGGVGGSSINYNPNVPPNPRLLPGVGGAGVVATGNVSITNAGTIGGGLSGNGGATRANAVELSGGNNTLTLHAGYEFIGNVVSRPAANGGDALVLGGDASPSTAFNVSNIVSTLPASYAGTQYVGFAHLAKTGASTWRLTGNGSAGQHWSIEDGTLQGDANTFAGHINFAPASPDGNPGVIFDQGSGNANSAVSAVYAGTISGAGSLTKIGDGKLTLTGDSTYTGTTTISEGTLALSGAGSIAASSAVIANGNLDIGGTLDGATLTSLAGTGSVTLGAQTLTLSNANGTFAGVIGGTGGLTLLRGTQTLSGVNTYSGGTTVTGDATLSISADQNLGAVSSTLNLDRGTLQTTAAVTTARAITIGNGARFQTDANLTANGVISGAASLIKSGAGTLTLGAANDYIGGTYVDAGTVELATTGAAGAGEIYIDNGANRNATLRVNAGVQMSNQVSIVNGATLHNAGAITRTAGGQYAVYSTGGGTITNSSTGIISGDDLAVLMTGEGSVINSGGLIESASSGFLGYGIYISGPGTVVNEAGGTIRARSEGVVLASGGSVVNDVGSTIVAEGGASSVVIQGGNATFVNKGALVGSVVLDSTQSATTIDATLFTGSSLQGGLDMGTNTAASLTLDGAGLQLLPTPSPRTSALLAGWSGKVAEPGSWTKTSLRRARPLPRTARSSSAMAARSARSRGRSTPTGRWPSTAPTR